MLNALIAKVMSSQRLDGNTLPAAIYHVLLPHERYHFTIRQHPAVLGGPLLLAVGWPFGALIVDQFLPSDSNSHLTLIIWAMWFAVLLRLAFRIYDWRESYLVFTELRLLITSGALVSTVQHIPFSTISGISFSRPLAGRHLNYGTLILEIGGADRVRVPLDYISNPEEISAEIHGIIFPGESMLSERCTEEDAPVAEN